ncbi:MAG: hypothetical protein ABSB54_11100 [Acidimicrobiales bacterium]|jgi:hypothetical protein
MPIATPDRPRFEERIHDDLRLGDSADQPAQPGWRAPSPEARRPILSALGVLIVLGCALSGAEVAAHFNHRSSYLAVATFVPQGSVITSSDLTGVSLAAGSGLAAVPIAESPTVVGRRASEPLEPGSLLVPADLTSEMPIASSEALVGTSLQTDQAPAGLVAGDSVLVVLGGQSSSLPTSTESSGTAPSSSPSEADIVAVGTVYAVALPSAADAASSTGTEAVTLEVPAAAAAQVTAASAASEVSLAEISTKAPS